MDFKNLNTILYKYFSQFKLGNPNVVNSVVMNIDYIIVNLPYFTNIGAVLDFILSDNEDLQFALKDYVPLIFRILKYKKELHKYKINKMKKENKGPQTPRKNKSIVFDDLDDVSKNKVVLWKGVLRGLSLKKFYNSWIVMEEKEDVAFTSTHLNEEVDVYDGVFKILAYHYDLLRDKISIELSPECLEKILKHIDLDSSQELLGKLLDKKSNTSLFPILKLLESVRACEYLINREKYYELLQYVEIMISTRGPSDSQSSDEEHNVWDELYGMKDKLLEIFLHHRSLYVWKPVYSILEILYKVKSDGEIKIYILEEKNANERCLEEEINKLNIKENMTNEDVKNGENSSKIDVLENDINELSLPVYETIHLTSLKQKFYVRLLCTPLDYSLRHIYASGLYKKFIRLFFQNPDDSFYGKCLFNFFKTSLQKKERTTALGDAGFIEELKKVILRNVAASFEGRPKTESIYPFCVYLCLLLKPYDLEDGDLLTVLKLSERVVEADFLKYSDDFRIDEYLENCLNDVIVRYTCNLVIDRMPVLSAFLSTEHHPDSSVEHAETREEKRIRIGGGMQDTL